MKYKPFTTQALSQIIYDALHSLDLYSESALKLLLGTCAQESHFGTYRKQIHGPAVGIFQMEPNTFNWLKDKYKAKFPSINDYEINDLEFNDKAAAIFCRLRYLADPHPLPPADNLNAIATYWKRVYNTYLGSGTVQEFLDNYRRFVD